MKAVKDKMGDQASRADLLPPENQIVIVKLPDDPGPGERRKPRFGWPDAVETSGFIRRNLVAFVTVIAPLLVSAGYYFVIASDQYISEARFVVRTSSNRTLGASQLVQSSAMVRSDEDTYLVNEFFRSRDAVRLLDRDSGLRGALGNPRGDYFNAWPTLFTGDTHEDLYQHFQNFVEIEFQSSTGITTMRVRAFTPQDARRLANSLLVNAEAMVNRLNLRARQDAVRFSQDVANQATKAVFDAQNAITAFRNRELVMDPAKQSVALLELVSRLQSERSTLEAALIETRAVTPDSPKIAAIVNKVAAIDSQIVQERYSIVGSGSSMVNKLAEYERLSLERELKTKALSAALVTLENARQDALKQQLYLERIVEPNLPDKSTYPKRLTQLLFTLMFCMAAYWIAKTISSVILDHDA